MGGGKCCATGGGPWRVAPAAPSRLARASLDVLGQVDVPPAGRGGARGPEAWAGGNRPRLAGGTGRVRIEGRRNRAGMTTSTIVTPARAFGACFRGQSVPIPAQLRGLGRYLSGLVQSRVTTGGRASRAAG